MGTGFGLWSFVLAITLIVVDIIIYYPFLKVYDSEILDEEEGRKESNSDLKEKVVSKFAATFSFKSELLSLRPSSSSRISLS
jgi:PTS system lactose-specific IIC component